GEKYYREQAELYTQNSLDVVCRMLADDEKVHAQLLSYKMNHLPYESPDSQTLSKAKNIFQDIAKIKIKGKENPSQLDFYRIALDKEKQSIDFYTEHAADPEAGMEKDLFVYLINQEKHHYEVLEELAALLKQAEDWVESAEFGLRKEYDN
ncbi:MAG: ferritin family protein, partial [Negativicutes bacterium]|nr:ferritin family protein [Negativicutes bacterium]